MIRIKGNIKKSLSFQGDDNQVVSNTFFQY